MNALPKTVKAAVEDASIETIYGKVCIHVLRESRQDFRLLRTATALAEAGYAVSLVDVVAQRTCPVREERSGVMIEHIVVPDWFTARRFELWFFMIAVQTFIRSVLHLMRTKADVYHASELTALPATFLAAALRRKKLIFELYDLQFPVPLTHVGFWRYVGASLYGLFLPHCAGVIVTSAYHGNEVKKRYKVPEMALLRNVPSYRAIEKTNRLRECLGISSHSRIILYQGNIQADRGLDQLVLAAQHLEPDSIIVIMGKGVGEVPLQLEALITREGMGERVKLLPAVAYEDLLEWTASADLGLTLFSPHYSLSIRYTLPNKLFEYLMAGLPVLSMELEAIAEVLRTSQVGEVIDSLDPPQIAAGINRMLADPAALAQLSRNALSLAREEFNWEKESLHLLRLYREILA